MRFLVRFKFNVPRLAVALHAKTEEAMRARLEQIGKVFSSQETAVENIIAATSNVESKLPQAQDVEVRGGGSPLPRVGAFKLRIDPAP